MSKQSRRSVSKDKDKDKGDEIGEVWLCVDCKKEFKESRSRMLECESVMDMAVLVPGVTWLCTID